MRFITILSLAFIVATPAFAAMKPEYKENARCRGALDVALEAFSAKPLPGETQEQANARIAKDSPEMIGFASNIDKALRWFEDTMLQGEATAVTASESSDLQKIEDAEANRLVGLINAAKTPDASDAALDQLITSIQPCFDKTGLFK